MFSSAKKYNDSKLILFTNKSLPNEYSSLLDEIGVEIVVLEEKHCQFVQSFTNTFPGCLFTLDVMKYLTTSNAIISSEKFLIVDSDCIFRETVDWQESCVAYEINYPLNRLVNGQSKQSLKEISDYLFACKEEDFKYYGGEFYLLSKIKLIEINNILENVVDFILKEKKLLNMHFTEEHILSIILNKCGCLDAAKANRVARIWLTRGYNNLNTYNKEAKIYHLPSEKERLFNKLFNQIIENKEHVDELNFSSISMSYVSSIPKPNILNKVIKSIKNLKGR
ncbi:hypothetical protein AB6T38_09680 [Aliiglaciecola sp. SL4]|uniref:hypothetical protein n=1 Tax=Aliiglaciecola sp. SL4 TaxID=3239806 RepID=UPI00355B7A27